MTSLPPALVGAAALAAVLHAAPAAAESLRCGGRSTEVGESRLAVLYKCGEPMLKDAFCAPVYTPNYQRGLQPLPEPYASQVVPCQPVEEWLYDRGPGQLMATVRFRGGIVQSIRYGSRPE